jgi:Rps23 Pro-64 3,4-dihydroxylase Tpa1-like proline 4-hydroxylase
MKYRPSHNCPVIDYYGKMKRSSTAQKESKFISEIERHRVKLKCSLEEAVCYTAIHSSDIELQSFCLKMVERMNNGG